MTGVENTRYGEILKMPTRPPQYNVASLGRKKEDVAVTFGAFDNDNPRSLINLVPTKMREKVEKKLDPAQGGDIRYISWSESKLERELNREMQKISGDSRKKLEAKDHMLRINFWAEYYRAQDTNSNMLEGNITRGISFHEDFHRRLNIPLYTAWILSAPTHLGMAQEETLMHAMRLLRRVVTHTDAIWDVKETSVIDKETGEEKKTRSKKLNVRAVTEIRKIAEDLANRRQGSVIQKHQVLTASISTPETQKSIPQAESREDLEAEIKKLEQAASGRPDTIDAEIYDNTSVDS